MLYKPNLYKIRDHGMGNNLPFYKWKINNGLKRNDPFKINFSNKVISITYIATAHTTDINSKSFKLINKNIKNKDLLIVEGIPYKLGLNLKDINYGTKKGNKNEMEFAIINSKKNKIDYTGIEPDDSILIKYLLNKNTTKKDLMLWYCLGEYSSSIRQNLSYSEFLNILTFVINYYSYYIGNSKFNFEKYFYKKFGFKFDYGKCDLEINSPNKNGKYFTNKLSHIKGILRDKLIIQNLYDLLNSGKYKNIILVYGANHSYAQFETLKETFPFYKFINS